MVIHRTGWTTLTMTQRMQLTSSWRQARLRTRHWKRRMNPKDDQREVCHCVQNILGWPDFAEAGGLRSFIHIHSSTAGLSWQLFPLPKEAFLEKRREMLFFQFPTPWKDKRRISSPADVHSCRYTLQHCGSWTFTSISTLDSLMLLVQMRGCSVNFRLVPQETSSPSQKEERQRQEEGSPAPPTCTARSTQTAQESRKTAPPPKQTCHPDLRQVRVTCLPLLVFFLFLPTKQGHTDRISIKTCVESHTKAWTISPQSANVFSNVSFQAD